MSQVDSFLAEEATRQNLSANGLPVDAVSLIDSLQIHRTRYDLVLVRVTKTLALLEDELLRLRPHLADNCRIIGCGMVKQIHNSTLKLFESIIGPTRTSLAKKKARLIFSEPDPALPVSPSPYPVSYPLEDSPFRLINHANVFSRDRLDIGTRLLLQHIPAQGLSEIVDLGCGNGVVGLIAAERNPNATIHFVDESYMAVASAKATFEASGLGNSAVFRVTNALGGFASESVDLILCNPPFHQQQVVGDFIAWRMFSQAVKVLKRRGELRIVGNRHLNYHAKLKRLFGNVQQLSADPKFVILRAVKR
ncbi:MAG: class I SAM-dependent methyltransferase [gamma proteobacterium endosymbiont of Lamellibrachia anaximandri]|nr:class I SAM-dependent methyltransferase [gamma proteobacterium endosymbiont of Lamellibrachia anaximandri]MBL3535215.1 class I SAM-dependent methyltransferase [gamma proteobacterium endosymbiont of Lamellibrachia anaximandri]